MAEFANLTTPIQPNQRYLILLVYLDQSPFMQASNGNEVLDTTYKNQFNQPASSLSLAYQWQFFEISNGNFVIANCNTGQFLQKNGTNDYKLGTDTDSCAMFSLMQIVGTDGNTGASICMRDVTGAGNMFLTYSTSLG